MNTLFVSDVHLCNQKPHITENFLNFLYHEAINATTLYILGDLFEIWIGDDNFNPLYIKISHALKYLHTHNIPCYFIHGNHDFLLGKQYAIQCGMILLPPQKILNLFGYRIIILHGDILCTHDINYQIFRKYARQTWLQKFFLSLPISMRLYITKIIQKNKKKQYTNIISHHIDQQAITKILLQENADIMIHGHIHQDKMFYKTINNTKILQRVVLGNWTQTGSIIKINKHGIFLMECSLKNTHTNINLNYKYQYIFNNKLKTLK